MLWYFVRFKTEKYQLRSPTSPVKPVRGRPPAVLPVNRSPPGVNGLPSTSKGSQSWLVGFTAKQTWRSVQSFAAARALHSDIVFARGRALRGGRGSHPRPCSLGAIAKSGARMNSSGGASSKRQPGCFCLFHLSHGYHVLLPSIQMMAAPHLSSKSSKKPMSGFSPNASWMATTSLKCTPRRQQVCPEISGKSGLGAISSSSPHMSGEQQEGRRRPPLYSRTREALFWAPAWHHAGFQGAAPCTSGAEGVTDAPSNLLDGWMVRIQFCSQRLHRSDVPLECRGATILRLVASEMISFGCGKLSSPSLNMVVSEDAEVLVLFNFGRQAFGRSPLVFCAR